jgi:hypothetical protein
MTADNGAVCPAASETVHRRDVADCPSSGPPDAAVFSASVRTLEEMVARFEAAGERQALTTSLESARALGKEIAGVLAEKLAATLPKPSSRWEVRRDASREHGGRRRKASKTRTADDPAADAKAGDAVEPDKEHRQAPIARPKAAAVVTETANAEDGAVSDNPRAKPAFVPTTSLISLHGRADALMDEMSGQRATAAAAQLPHAPPPEPCESPSPGKLPSKADFVFGAATARHGGKSRAVFSDDCDSDGELRGSVSEGEIVGAGSWGSKYASLLANIGALSDGEVSV